MMHVHMMMHVHVVMHLAMMMVFAAVRHRLVGSWRVRDRLHSGGWGHLRGRRSAEEGRNGEGRNG
jgi:hypothetical protein